MGFPRGSGVKNPPLIQETREMWVLSLGREDPFEEELAAHSSILSWKKSQRSLVGYSPWGHKELDMTEQLTHKHTHTYLNFTLSFFLIKFIRLFLIYFLILAKLIMPIIFFWGRKNFTLNANMQKIPMKCTHIFSYI